MVVPYYNKLLGNQMLLLFNAIECNIEETLLGVENDKYFIFVNQSEKLLKTVDNELFENSWQWTDGWMWNTNISFIILEAYLKC